MNSGTEHSSPATPGTESDVSHDAADSLPAQRAAPPPHTTPFALGRLPAPDSLHAVIGGLEEGVVIQDDTGAVLAANPAALHLLGLSLDQLQGRAARDPSWRVVSAEGAELADWNQAVSEAPASTAVETTIGVWTPDGRITWVRATHRPHLAPDGMPDSTITHLVDITGLLGTEQALQQTDHRFRLLADTATDLVLELDTEGQVVWASAGAGGLLGWSPAELLGSSLASMAEPADRARVESWRLDSAGRSASDVVPLEYRCRTASGKPQWVTARCRTQPSGLGPGLTVVLRLLDDTIRHRLELADHAEALAGLADELQVEKERLRLVMFGTRLGLWDWNMVTGSTTFDERWAEIIGYRLEDLQPTSIETWMEHSHPDDLAASNEQIQRYLAGEIPFYDCEVRMRHREGHWVWVHDRGQVVEWAPDGSPVRMAGTHEDITELVSARRARDDERTRLRATIDSHMDPHVLLESVRDRKGIVDFVFREVNDAACLEVDRDRDLLIGATLSSVAPAGAHPVWQRNLAKVVLSGQPLVVDDLPEERADGLHFYDVRASPAGDGVSCTWRDVTARHRAAEELAAAQKHYRLLADNAQDVVFLLDVDGRVVWISPSLTSILGWREAQVLGHPLTGLIHPEDLREAQGLLTVAGLRNRHRQPFRVQMADGGYLWMSGAAGPAYDENGRDVGIIGSLHDVHLQVLAERDAAQVRRRFARMFRTHEAVMLLVDPQSGEIVDANLSALEFYGYTQEQMQEMLVTDLNTLPTEQVKPRREQAGGGRGTRFVAPHRLADGSIRSMEVHSSLIQDGERELLFSILRDVTEDLAAREDLAASERQFRLLSDNAMDVVMRIVDREIVWVSSSLTRMLGWGPDDWLGHSFHEFLLPEEAPQLSADQARVEAGESSVSRFRILSSEGQVHWIETHSHPLQNSDGRREGIVTTFRTVDKEVAAEWELRQRAELDTLTGLLDRSEALSRIEARRRAGEHMALLFCDLDSFKALNDTYGHLVGDDVLRHLAARIRHCVRGEDIGARVGGDEIMVALPGVRSAEDAVSIAEKIRRRARRPIHIDGQAISATLSIGVTLLGADEDAHVAIARADKAMYLAKRAGRDRVVSL